MKEHTPCKKNFFEITTKDSDKYQLNVIGISHIDLNFIKSDSVIIYMINKSQNIVQTFDITYKEYLRIKDLILDFEVKELKE